MGQVLYRYRVGLTALLGALLIAGAIAAGTSAQAEQSDGGRAGVAAKGGAAPAGTAPAGQTDLGRLLSLRDRFVGDVARELGESPARLRGALRTVIDRWLEHWTRAGMLTRGQAAALLDCWDGARCTPGALMRAP
jgi:hypothetical protein